jgi:hypothetical protein
MRRHLLSSPGSRASAATDELFDPPGGVGAVLADAARDHAVEARARAHGPDQHHGGAAPLPIEEPVVEPDDVCDKPRHAHARLAFRSARGFPDRGVAAAAQPRL